MNSLSATGADGFVGSHLTELLVQEGYKVKALSHYNTSEHWGSLEEVACCKEIEILSGDVRDSRYCSRIIKDVDIVFHLTALIAIPYSYVAPNSYVNASKSLGSLIKSHRTDAFGLLGEISFYVNKLLITGSWGAKLAGDEFRTCTKHLITTARRLNFEYAQDELGVNYLLPSTNTALSQAQHKQFKALTAK